MTDTCSVFQSETKRKSYLNNFIPWQNQMNPAAIPITKASKPVVGPAFKASAAPRVLVAEAPDSDAVSLEGPEVVVAASLVDSAELEL